MTAIMLCMNETLDEEDMLLVCGVLVAIVCA